MERKRNRNAIRSVNMIMDAYVELLEETPAEKITVTAIVNKAGLNRSTFYAHFENPDGVQNMLEQKLVDDLLESMKDFDLEGLMKNPKPLLELVAGRIEAKMSYVKLMFEKHSAAHWMDSLREAVIEKFMSDPQAEMYDDKDMLLLNVRFFVGGYISLCRDCITNRLNRPLSSLTDTLSKTISGGLAATYTQK